MLQRNNILRLLAVQPGPKAFVKQVLQHRSEKHPVQQMLSHAADNVLSPTFGCVHWCTSAYTDSDKAELLNLAIAVKHSQCIEAGLCSAHMGFNWQVGDTGTALYAVTKACEFMQLGLAVTKTVARQGCCICQSVEAKSAQLDVGLHCHMGCGWQVDMLA